MNSNLVAKGHQILSRKLNMNTYYLSAVYIGLIAMIAGCSAKPQTATPTASDQSVAANEVDGSIYLLDSEPEGAGNVIKVRDESANDDEVLVVGRIGGSSNPWIEGRVAFTIVDESLKACNDVPGDNCPAPWDYCCETTKLPTATALVKFVDESGSVVKADPKSMLGVEELSTIVVKGKAQRDEAGNLTVLASGIFVKQK